ncbi:MAG: hypothetical protein K1X56_05285 [Flavobacteriales bacterium]|nr:hypothetical protein [Flavobacteriales bacterium]
MKYIGCLITILCLSLFSSCGKDDPINPEDVLFKRLSTGNGIWKLEKVEYISFDANGNETLDSALIPDQQYIFYEKSEEIDGLIISYHAVSISEPNNTGITYSIWAEKERVIFYPVGDILNSVAEFAVEKDEKNKQTWIRFVNLNGKVVFHLEKCPDCTPYYTPYTENGI